MTEKQVWAYAQDGLRGYAWRRVHDPVHFTAKDELLWNKIGRGHVRYRVIVTPKPQWTEHELAALVGQGLSPCPR